MDTDKKKEELAEWKRKHMRTGMGREQQDARNAELSQTPSGLGSQTPAQRVHRKI
jgi:hypothetical protein